ncbi:MAG TPA: AI-2E family transporter [Rhizomicrobium sp.]|nr:AI-2E family transporter [Rhizomicrobium sp.]
MQKIKDPAFLLLLVAVTAAFFWILQPFYGAILWGIAAAIVFYPLHSRLRAATGNRQNLAATVTVLLVLAVVILPVILVGASLGQQASGVYDRVQSGELNFTLYMERILEALPGWAKGVLNHFGLDDPATAMKKLAEILARTAQSIASQALGIGRGAFDLVIGLAVMLYLLFFLLRDGEPLLSSAKAAVPIRPEHTAILLNRTSEVVRATVKGGIAVAAVQGMLGGVAFWILGIPGPLLWAAVMAFLSLLPALGAAIVWAPVAVYLLATGNIWQGLFLLGFGVLVIGLIDNLLRPVLVGRSAKLPDYVVLITTLGGIEVFGLNGFVIGPLIAAIFFVSWELFRGPQQDS